MNVIMIYSSKKQMDGWVMNAFIRNKEEQVHMRIPRSIRSDSLFVWSQMSLRDRMKLTRVWLGKENM